MKRRVVVTGMGTINPLSGSVKESYRRLMNKESGISKYNPIWHVDKQLLSERPTLFEPWSAAQVADSSLSSSNVPDPFFLFLFIVFEGVEGLAQIHAISAKFCGSGNFGCKFARITSQNFQ